MAQKSADFACLSDKDVTTCTFCEDTLLDPILLQCLHNGCRHCVEVEAGDSKTVTCRTCEVVTDITVKCDNMIVGPWALRFLQKTDKSKCVLCDRQGKTNMSVSTWCTQCHILLCDGCTAQHKLRDQRHECKDLDGTTKWTDLSSTCNWKCHDHGKELELICLDCVRVVCSECYSTVCSGHAVKAVTASEATDQFEKMRDDCKKLISKVEESASVLNYHIGLPEALETAKTAGLLMLSDAKSQVTESVISSHDNAKASLLTYYDDKLKLKAFEIKFEASSYRKKVSHAIKYCTDALNIRPVTTLLSQLPVIKSRLNTLLEELAELKAPTDSSKIVQVNVRVPPDVDHIVSRWIGRPRLCTEDLFCPEENLAALLDANDYTTKEERLLGQLEEKKAEQDKLLAELRLEKQQLSILLQHSLNEKEKTGRAEERLPGLLEENKAEQDQLLAELRWEKQQLSDLQLRSLNENEKTRRAQESLLGLLEEKNAEQNQLLAELRLEKQQLSDLQQHLLKENEKTRRAQARLLRQLEEKKSELEQQLEELRLERQQLSILQQDSLKEKEKANSAQGQPSEDAAENLPKTKHKRWHFSTFKLKSSFSSGLQRRPSNVSLYSGRPLKDTSGTDVSISDGQLAKGTKKWFQVLKEQFHKLGNSSHSSGSRWTVSSEPHPASHKQLYYSGRRRGLLGLFKTPDTE